MKVLEDMKANKFIRAQVTQKKGLSSLKYLTLPRRACSNFVDSFPPV